MTRIDIVERLMMAHGGRDAWADVTAISARLSSGGLAYASRLQSGALNHKEAVVELEERRVTIYDFPRPGWWGQWHDTQVAIGRDGGELERERANARHRFRGWWAQPRWDDLDLLYFVGYALWNYLSFPRLLEVPGVEIALARGGRLGQPSLLAVRFPADIPTHCRQQYFFLDADDLLLRHDYVAEVFGTWASGANHCERCETVGGLRLYTRRRVTPALGRWGSIPLLNLVWIELDDVSVHRAKCSTAADTRAQADIASPPDSHTQPTVATTPWTKSRAKEG